MLSVFLCSKSKSAKGGAVEHVQKTSKGKAVHNKHHAGVYAAKQKNKAAKVQLGLVKLQNQWATLYIG